MLFKKQSIKSFRLGDENINYFALHPSPQELICASPISSQREGKTYRGKWGKLGESRSLCSSQQSPNAAQHPQKTNPCSLRAPSALLKGLSSTARLSKAGRRSLCLLESLKTARKTSKLLHSLQEITPGEKKMLCVIMQLCRQHA